MYKCPSCGTMHEGYICHECGYIDTGLREHLSAERKEALSATIVADDKRLAECEPEVSGWIDNVYRSSKEEPM